MKKKAGKRTIRNLIIFVFLAILILFYFGYTRSRISGGNKVATLSEAQKILKEDLSIDYPATPSEVVALYSRIMKCMINYKPSEEEVEQLNRQLRLLLASELLDNNSEDSQLEAIKQEIKGYRKSGMKLTYEISSRDNTEIKKVEGTDTALVRAEYTLSGKKATTVTGEEFILQKETDGKWKIIGWRQGSGLGSLQEDKESEHE